MDLKTLAATGSAVTATALVGAAASRDVSSSWYRQLDKPSFQPPGVAFPVVWTSLYADVAVSTASALDRLRARGDEEQARRLAVALGLNLAANASWTWLFFRWHRLGASVAAAGALAVSGADLARRAGAVDRRAAVGLGVYAGWCAFATALSAAIWRRNRG